MCKLNTILVYEKLGRFMAKIDQVSLIFCEIEECRIDKNWAQFSARIQNTWTAFRPNLKVDKCSKLSLTITKRDALNYIIIFLNIQ